MNTLKFVGICIISSALSFFSYSLMNVAKEIQQVRETLPNVLQQIQAIEQDIDVPAWSKLIKSIQGEIPPLLTAAGEIRQTLSSINDNVPNILLEAKALRETTIPNVLDELARIRTESIPPAINEIRVLRKATIPSILDEVKIVREDTVPSVLSEVAAVRAMTPETLARVENIVEHAEKTADAASQGAVTGTVKGILKTPLTIIKGAVDKPKELLKKEK